MKKIVLNIDEVGGMNGVGVEAQGVGQVELIFHLMEVGLFMAKQTAANHKCDDPRCQAVSLCTDIVNALEPVIAPKHKEGQERKIIKE